MLYLVIGVSSFNSVRNHFTIIIIIIIIIIRIIRIIIIIIIIIMFLFRTVVQQETCIHSMQLNKKKLGAKNNTTW